MLPVHVGREGAEILDGRESPDRRLPRPHPVQVVVLRLDVDHCGTLGAGGADHVGHTGEHDAVAVAEKCPGEVALLHVVLCSEGWHGVFGGDEERRTVIGEAMGVQSVRSFSTADRLTDCTVLRCAVISYL